jgi:hypothetical protein
VTGPSACETKIWVEAAREGAETHDEMKKMVEVILAIWVEVAKKEDVTEVTLE